MLVQSNSQQLSELFSAGNVFAYPTEAVFGLGCDPANQHAVMTLLEIKQRPMHKGLILIASELSQLEPYVDFDAIPAKRYQQVIASWPGPYTWLLPKLAGTADYLTGGSELIAVRVSAHPTVVSMCQHLNSAVVSTSANLTGHPPALNQQQVTSQFNDLVPVVRGQIGEQTKPSQIRHGLTGEIIRAN